jgi:hypothetical protein
VLGRAVLIWFALLLAAIANGALREAMFVPRMGHAAAHALSTLLLALAIALVAWFWTPWIDPHSGADAWTIGVLWATATVAFEFLGGHFIFGTPWAHLLADYDITAGRIWILVPAVTLISPVVVNSQRTLV